MFIVNILSIIKMILDIINPGANINTWEMKGKLRNVNSLQFGRDISNILVKIKKMY